MDYDIEIKATLTKLTWLNRVGLIFVLLGCKLNGFCFEVK